MQYDQEINLKVNQWLENLEQRRSQCEIEALKIEIIEKDKLKQERARILEQRRKVEKELADQGLISPILKYERGSISQEVKDKVWNRDQGKCVECGLSERLEFDHIIPLSRGGANTYRNLQLLCEGCNRKKSNNIG